jgi:uncharacterized protein YebE (UPF0316 family)
MNISAFLDSWTYAWVILPLLIFFARITDVSLDTLRIIFINKNLRYRAALCGFFEVMIWLMVIRQIFQQLNNPLCFIAYPAGFAAGNIVGLMIENRISLGKVIIRTITRHNADELIRFLKSSGYGVTVVDAEGTTGPVQLIFTIVERSDIPNVVENIKKHNPNAFYSVEDIRYVSESVTPYRNSTAGRWSNFTARMRRKE